MVDSNINDLFIAHEDGKTFLFDVGRDDFCGFYTKEIYITDEREIHYYIVCCITIDYDGVTDYNINFFISEISAKTHIFSSYIADMFVNMLADANSISLDEVENIVDNIFQEKYENVMKIVNNKSAELLEKWKNAKIDGTEGEEK